MPGSLTTSARRRPQMRLNSVDLPTLGRPRMATRGRLDMMGRRVPARWPMLRTRSPILYAILFGEKSKDRMAVGDVLFGRVTRIAEGVILSEAKNPCISAQGKLREGSALRQANNQADSSSPSAPHL